MTKDLLVLFVALLRRSDDSGLLRGGAVGWRHADGRMRRKGGARGVRAGQEGYSLLSAGGDGPAGPRLLPQLGGSSSRSVTPPPTPTHTQRRRRHVGCVLYIF